MLDFLRSYLEVTYTDVMKEAINKDTCLFKEKDISDCSVRRLRMYPSEKNQKFIENNLCEYFL